MSARKKGNTYRFKHGASPELTYLGYNWSGNGYWHQFAKVGESEVWSEIRNSDLHMIELITIKEG